jgi:hypothetical protein
MRAENRNAAWLRVSEARIISTDVIPAKANAKAGIK